MTTTRNPGPRLKAIAAAAAFASCSLSCSSMSVNTDYDPRADFSRYRTYDWIPSQQASQQPAPGTANPFLHNTLLDSRIKSALDRGLSIKGLRQSHEKPDMYVVYQTRAEQKVEANTAGLGIGYGYGPYVGYTGPGLGVTQYTEGTLIVDFVNPESNQLIWRGYASKALDNTDVGEQIVAEAVQKILEKYPPRPKS
jgi:hypothetical protein